MQVQTQIRHDQEEEIAKNEQNCGHDLNAGDCAELDSGGGKSPGPK